MEVETVKDDASRVERNSGGHAERAGGSRGRPVPLDAERGRVAEREVPLRGEASKRERGWIEKKAERARSPVVEGIDVVGLLVSSIFSSDGRGAGEEDTRAAGQAGETE